MPRMTSNIPDLPIEANIKDEELKKIVKQYNLSLQKLATILYGDISDLHNRIKEIEEA